MKYLLNPTKVQLNDIDKLPEEKLFIMVISQAFTDAMYKGPYRDLLLYKRDAIDWFENNGTDFELICLLSSFNTETIIKAYNEAKKNGLIQYTEYQYRYLYSQKKPVKQNKFMLRITDEFKI
ncbi:MAG: hypothetical protein O3A39_06885 [Proteobacteria bacterium]|nr:hypothetical protein [Pseudomonadota bacterium]